MLPKCSSPPALPGTDPAPLQGNPQAVMSMSAPTPGPSKEGEVPSQSANMCWPKFPALQHEFSTLVSNYYYPLLQSHEMGQPREEQAWVCFRCTTVVGIVCMEFCPMVYRLLYVLCSANV